MLGLFPRLRITHTDDHSEGQIYIGAINWALLVGCVAMVAGFQDTTALVRALICEERCTPARAHARLLTCASDAQQHRRSLSRWHPVLHADLSADADLSAIVQGHAYGVAVMSVMFITTILSSMVMVICYGEQPAACLLSHVSYRCTSTRLQLPACLLPHMTARNKDSHTAASPCTPENPPLLLHRGAVWTQASTRCWSALTPCSLCAWRASSSAAPSQRSQREAGELQRARPSCGQSLPLAALPACHHPVCAWRLLCSMGPAAAASAVWQGDHSHRGAGCIDQAHLVVRRLQSRACCACTCARMHGSSSTASWLQQPVLGSSSMLPLRCGRTMAHPAQARLQCQGR